MINFLDDIFNYYQYEKIGTFEVVNHNDVLLYKHKNAAIANYFLVFDIDCREFEDDQERIKIALDELEKMYCSKSNENDSLKNRVINKFETTQKASQVDKNTSSIYLVLFNDIDKLNNYRNEVYSIEESPNYFKRYVLPYTLNQLNQVKQALSQFPDKPLDEALCQIVDNEDSYFDLVEKKALDSTYSFVIRMFSKLPFLQYKFKTELAPEPIEKHIERKLKNESQIKYHQFLCKDDINIDDILLLENNLVIHEDEIKKEIAKMLKGAK